MTSGKHPYSPRVFVNELQLLSTVISAVAVIHIRSGAVSVMLHSVLILAVAVIPANVSSISWPLHSALISAVAVIDPRHHL